MDYLFPAEEWAVTEESYQPQLNRFLETIFFTGNGYIGLRGTPEEWTDATNSTAKNFLAPIYDLLPIRADGLVRNVTHCSVNVPCPNWFGMTITLDGTPFDLQQGTVLDYRRSLDLRTGTLTRVVRWRDDGGRESELRFTRVVSMANRHLAAQRVVIRPLNWHGMVTMQVHIDATVASEQDVTHVESNAQGVLSLTTETRVTHFETATVLQATVFRGDQPIAPQAPEVSEREVQCRYETEALQDEEVVLEKLVAICSSRDGQQGEALARAEAHLHRAGEGGYAAMVTAHEQAVAQIWREGDVEIDGDPAAQQGIRFCIFNMHQNYAGGNPLVNMAAKGLSGPGYGGLYWWDTEMYMMPFFLYTAPEKARNLLHYRYLTLDGAREKARHYRYDGAMYPWVTIDGPERSGDWQYGMLEQHVSSAVAHAVKHYLQVTGDDEFLWQYGVEMLVETSRFWASRVTFSERKGRYGINHITGPDEYAVAINNNCYCNVMAQANLEYGSACVRRMQHEQPARWQALAQHLHFRDEELARWDDVAARMYVPYDAHLGIHEQDDSFLDRDPINWRDVPPEDKPTSKWPWHQLMKSQAMKQADVVLLMLQQHERYDLETKRRNYQFYEPKTTHESSLSPCIHAIIAAEIGREEEAFQYYLKSARLDLDDVNGNADEGLHIANTAGSWLCIMNGFAGMRVANGRLHFTPHLPARWQRLAFTMTFQGRRLQVTLTQGDITVKMLHGDALEITVNGNTIPLAAGGA